MTKKSIQLIAGQAVEVGAVPAAHQLVDDLADRGAENAGDVRSSHSAIVSWSSCTAAGRGGSVRERRRGHRAVRAQHAEPLRLGRSGVADDVHRGLQVAVPHAAAVRPQRVERAVARRPQVVELEAQLPHELADVHVPGVDELAAVLGRSGRRRSPAPSSSGRRCARAPRRPASRCRRGAADRRRRSPPGRRRRSPPTRRARRCRPAARARVVPRPPAASSAAPPSTAPAWSTPRRV